MDDDDRRERAVDVFAVDIEEPPLAVTLVVGKVLPLLEIGRQGFPGIALRVVFETAFSSLVFKKYVVNQLAFYC